MNISTLSNYGDVVGLGGANQSTNFNQSLVTNGVLINASYKFCSDAGCYQSGANVSFRVYATDSAGNVNTTRNITVQVNDTVKPNVTVTINGAGTGANVSTTTISLNWSITERNNIYSIAWSLDKTTIPVDSVRSDKKAGNYTVNGGITQAVLNSYKTQPPGSDLSTIPATGAQLANGTHNITVYVIDSWGNLENATYTFTVDTTVPYTISILQDLLDQGVTPGLVPFNMTNYGWMNVTVNYSASGLRSLQYNTTCNGTLQTIFNNTKFQPFNNTLCLAASTGFKTLTVVATSGSGGANTTAFTVGLDRTAPDITLDSINSITSIQGAEFRWINISLNFSTPTEWTYISSVGYYLDDNKYVQLAGGNVDQKLSYNYSINVTYGGKHSLILQANDSVGNAANTTTYAFTVVGPVDLNIKELELNASLGPTNIKRVNITNTTGGEAGAITVNSSNPIIIAIQLEVNTTLSATLNITIDGINSSAVRWEYLNFSVVSDDAPTKNSVTGNFSATVLRMIRFNSSIDDFIPDTNSYFGRIIVPYNLTSTNDSKFVAMWFTDETDYSSRSLISVCGVAGGTTPYLSTTASACYNVTADGKTTIFVPHFSTVVVANDTMAPTIAINIPTSNQADSTFMVNITVSQDTSSCKFMINASGYYNGAAQAFTSWTTMATPALLSGTSQYVCLSSYPVSLANNSAPEGAYNITFNVTDAQGNSNTTVVFDFNVTDTVPPQWSNITNRSITSTGATIRVESNEYVNASVTYSSGTIRAQSSPFTTRTSSITLSLSASTRYNYTVKVCDYAGNCNISEEYNFTTDTAAAEAAAAAAGSSGGGGATVAAPTNIAAKQSQIWNKINAGESISMELSNDNIAITNVATDVKNTVTSVSIEAASLKAQPSDATAASSNVYQYLQIKPVNIRDDDIIGAKISFEVTTLWLDTNKVAKEDIALLRYKDNNWDILPTSIVGSSAYKIKYEATTPGFSYFAIGSKSGVGKAPAEGAAAGATTTTIPEGAAAGEEMPIVTPPAGANYIWIVGLIVIVIIVLIFLVMRKKGGSQQ